MRIGVWISVAMLAAGLLLQHVPTATAGLLVMIATPLARVVLLVRAFAKERDWPFVALSISVILLLGASLMLAMR